MERISHWVGGKVVPGESGRTGPVFNPATGEQTHEVDFASTEEVGQAVAAAAEAFRPASGISPGSSASRKGRSTVGSSVSGMTRCAVPA